MFWNSLPDDLRDTELGTNDFRQYLEMFLFSLYQCIQRMRGLIQECAIDINPHLTTTLTIEIIIIWPSRYHASSELVKESPD